ncbi:ABC transporter permease [Actinoplanes solisilvae]|uniref:ABC transporter permease n=1 Tax=Actinoplanes solisilvae TaxID=2486853 RepID=UPI000FDC5316|nr:ABC transporter permease [Actinoplanes solisilvae]
MSTYAAAKVVAAREIKVRLRDKTFLFSTAFFLLFAIGVTVLPAIFAGGPSSVAVADRATAAILQQGDFDVRVVADDAAAEKLVRDGDVDAAVLAGPEVIALDDRPGEVVSALSTAPPVRLLDPGTVDPFLAYIVPFALAFVFFMTSFLFGLQISQSVTEEKQTRIVEILVASVPTRALLAGKVAALGLLAFTQVALIAIVTLVGARLAGLDSGVLSLLEPTIGWFVAFFLIGFLMLAALWAGVGALASRPEDLNGVSQPVQMAVMLPFFAVIFLAENPLAMTILSYVPFSAPIAMPTRIFQGNAAAWEPFVALLIMAVTAVGLLAAGARVYEGSLLRTNGKTSWATAWRSRTTTAG